MRRSDRTTEGPPTLVSPLPWRDEEEATPPWKAIGNERLASTCASGPHRLEALGLSAGGGRCHSGHDARPD